LVSELDKANQEIYGLKMPKEPAQDENIS